MLAQFYISVLNLIIFDFEFGLFLITPVAGHLLLHVNTIILIRLPQPPLYTCIVILGCTGYTLLFIYWFL